MKSIMCNTEFPQNTWSHLENRSAESPPIDPGTLDHKNGQVYCHRSSMARPVQLPQAQQQQQQQPFQGFDVANGREPVTEGKNYRQKLVQASSICPSMLPKRRLPADYGSIASDVQQVHLYIVYTYIYKLGMTNNIYTYSCFTSPT